MHSVTPRDALLTLEDLDRFHDSHEIIYPVGATLMVHGNNDKFVLYLLDGYVKSVQENPGDKPRSAHVVGLHGPGDVVGEMAAVTGLPRTADVVAMTDVRARYITGDAWVDFISRNNRVLLALYRRAELLRARMTAQLVDSDVTADQKVAAALVRLADTGIGATDGNNLTVRDIDQHDLAGLSGMSLALLNKVLSRFRSQGLITTGRRRFTIHNLAQIKAISDLLSQGAK